MKYCKRFVETNLVKNLLISHWIIMCIGDIFSVIPELLKINDGNYCMIGSHMVRIKHQLNLNSGNIS